MSAMRPHALARPPSRSLLALLLIASLSLAVAWTARAQSGRTKTNAPARTRPVERARRTTQPPDAPPPQTTPAPSPTPARPPVIMQDDGDEAPPPRRTPMPAAQEPVRPVSEARRDEIDDGDVVSISSNLVPVPASVVDSQGRVVVNLDLKDFELVVDGQVRPIGDLTRSETPVALALLFDNSSSLRATREFEEKAAVEFFRRVMRPVDRAAVWSISTEPHLAMPLTSDVRALVRTIQNFGRPEGATALFDTVAEAAKYLKPHGGRKVIVIVSDGTDTVSSLTFDETLARVLAADCQVYSVQTGHSDNPNLRDLAGERRLQEFAENTGASVHAPRREADFNAAFSQIAADLSQQYILGYYPRDARRDGRFHTISLRVTTRQNLRVRTRKGFYSPRG